MDSGCEPFFSARVDAKMIELVECRQCGGLGLARLLSARIEAARESTRLPLPVMLTLQRQQHSPR